MTRPALRIAWAFLALTLIAPWVGAQEDPAVAAPKTDPKGGPRFLQMHQQFLDRGKAGNIDLLFLGDSITELWAKRGKDVWTKNYGSLHAANFGISGDKTQHVLWRIDHGELDGIHPKVLVLMIGTNNTALNSVESIAAADVKIVHEIRQKLPDTKILLLAIFPRGKDKTDPLRQKIDQINPVLAKLDDGKMIRYLDLGPKFTTTDGAMLKDLMQSDLLHPSPKGYVVWAQAMQPLLLEMMK